MNKFKPRFCHPRPPQSTIRSLINSLSSQNAHHQVLLTYTSTLNSNTHSDPYTVPSLLKACTSLNLFSHGLSFHQQILVNGYSTDPYISASLINFYAKFGHIQDAHKVFDKMTERNVVPWTTMIGFYSRAGDVNMALTLYNSMRYEGVQPSSVTMLGVLPGVSKGSHVKCVHGGCVRYGFGSDLNLMNSLVDLYGKCGGVEDAKDLFDSMDRRDVVSWNSLVSVYALNGDTGEILKLLYRMRVEGVEPDQQTFGSLASAATRERNRPMGKLVHAKIVTGGFELVTQVLTSLVVMYLNSGDVNDAFQIFEKSPDKDVILWSAMISGLVQNECADKAISVFQRMLNLGVIATTVTITCALAACAQLGAINLGTSIHGYILRERVSIDISTQNSLVTMYAKCGRLVQSYAVFDLMERRDLVTWNAIVAGHAQNGHIYQAFYLFNEMRESLQRPDSITVVSLLQAGASLGAIHQGKWIHNFVIRSCLSSCLLIDTALVDMYSKCGDLNSARKCFDRMSKHDLVPWSAIISGYGSDGNGEAALDMYSKFLQTGLKPNHVIFLALLVTCSHNGLIDQGMRLFHSMTNDYDIKPKVEHCACVVDLLCRANRVEDAYNFYKRMFPEPTVDVLGILVDACRAKGKTELGEIIAREIVMLNPVDAGNYVQLAHSYASLERWEGVGEAWMRMRSLGLKKIPGWSFIELHGTITTFFMGHSAHSQHEDIMLVLKSLSTEIRKLPMNFHSGNFVIDSGQSEKSGSLLQELEIC